MARAPKASPPAITEWGQGTIEPPDMVNSPPHYANTAIECIDAMEAMLGLDGFIAYLRGTIFKYNWRVLAKLDPVEDSRKLGWYQARLTLALQKNEVEKFG